MNDVFRVVLLSQRNQAAPQKRVWPAKWHDDVSFEQVAWERLSLMVPVASQKQKSLSADEEKQYGQSASEDRGNENHYNISADSNTRTSQQAAQTSTRGATRNIGLVDRNDNLAG